MRLKNRQILLVLAAGALFAGCASGEDIVGERGEKCKLNSDCKSNFCNKGVCAERESAQTCSNGVKDGTETDVDCGGLVCDVCDAGQSCEINTDCESARCIGGSCAPDDDEIDDPTLNPDTPKKGEIWVTEVLNTIKQGTAFDENSSEQTEFVEIYNSSDRTISLTGSTLTCTREDSDSTKPFTINLMGSIAAHNAIVLSNTAITGLPEGVTNELALTKAGVFINSATYICSIKNANSVEVNTFEMEGSGTTDGISVTQETFIYESTGSALVAHNSISRRRHSPGFCTNGGLFINNCDNGCNNNMLNVGETDIDCGGLSCDACGEDKACSANSDCESGYCASKFCTHKPCSLTGCDAGMQCGIDGYCYSCSDGIKNGNETDIDCGGTGCGQCNMDRACQSDVDCLSLSCVDGVCAGPAVSCEAMSDRSTLEITEVFNYVNAANSMNMWQSDVQQNQVEFIEIVNKSDHDKAISLEGIVVEILRTDIESAKDNYKVALNGCLQKNQALVLSGSRIKGLPAGVRNLVALPLTGALVNTASYEIQLIAADHGELDPAFSDIGTRNTKSQISDVVNEEAASRYWFVAHDTLNAQLKQSPGYCTNGALYIDQCDTLCDNQKIDYAETDVDCGGNLCQACTEGQKCLVGSDCDSKQCINGVCDKKPCTEIGCSDGFTCDTRSGLCISCDDKILNGSETDVDCGGSCDAKCGDGKTCKVNSDCESEACDNGTCVSCDDKIKNGTETDVDCGGVCATKYDKKCHITEGCATNNDCVSYSCNADGVCDGEELEYASIVDVMINEVYGKKGTAANKKIFPYNDNNAVCEFVEIVSTAGREMRLNDLKLVIVNNTDQSKAEVALNIALPGHNVLVAHNCGELALPDDAISIALPDNSFKDTIESYSLYLLNSVDGTSSEPVTAYIAKFVDANGQPVSNTGESNTRAIDANEKTTLVQHSTLVDGIFASPGYCVNGGWFSDECVEPCQNKRKDYREADADCGGVCEAKCANRKSCKEGTDCISGICDSESKTCVSCDDKIKNGDETGVDCGGICPNKCATGVACKLDSDCASSSCVEGKCVGSACETPVKGDMLITEVFAAPTETSLFESLTAPTSIYQNEFFEIVNNSTKRLDISNVSLSYVKSNTTDTPKTFSLKSYVGCLEPHQAFIVSNLALSEEEIKMLLPDGVQNLKLFGNRAIANTSDFDVYLKYTNDKNEEIFIDRVINNKQKSGVTGISQTRSVWNEAWDNTDETKGLSLVQHEGIQQQLTEPQESTGKIYNYSPGYCSNGKEYVKLCQ